MFYKIEEKGDSAMSFCQHQWEDRTAILRELFTTEEARSHEFFVCSRCLRIHERDPKAEAHDNPFEKFVDAA